MTNDTNLTSALHDWAEIFMRRSMHDFVQFSRDSGLSMTQLSALMRLYHQGACGVSDIGNHLAVSNAAASQMIDRLVGLGYLERSEDPDDRRVRQVTMTAKGRRLIEDGIAARRQWMEALTTALSPDEQELIIEAMTLL
ncbi:MAG: MarR family winged helix-turn-helix transcriptional regulator, partial [Anaerolineales bacterium]